MSLTGKVAKAWGGGGKRPLCKGFKTLSLLQLMRRQSWTVALGATGGQGSQKPMGAGLCAPGDIKPMPLQVTPQDSSAPLAKWNI